MRTLGGTEDKEFGTRPLAYQRGLSDVVDRVHLRAVA